MAPKVSDALLPQESSVSKPRIVEKTVSLESGINEGALTDCTCKETGYGAGDAVFASVLVAPLVVGVWRGTWGLMELHGEVFPYAQSYVLGIVIHVCFALIRSQLLSRSIGAWGETGGAGRWLRERVLSRLYTYVFMLACIMHWRGGWGILDAAIVAIIPRDDDPHRGVLYAAVTMAFYVTMMLLRSSRNFLATPYFLVTDGKEATYMFTTRFRKSSSRETALYVLDCVFSVGVVGSLVVFVWRGSWALLDIYLYPEAPLRSCLTSVAMGYALVVATFALQAPARWAAARLHGAPRLLLADFYHLVSFFATVNVWRGVWGLLDIYLFPDSPKLSNWCSHVVSLALLVMLNCSNTVIVRGVYIDAEEPAGECVIFPCHYLRLYFHNERTKERHRKALCIAAAAAASRKSEDHSIAIQLPDDKV